MPHFAVDESAHGHRKLVRAGNAAVGLWVRLGSYSCQQLSDGVIPAEIAAAYGTAPQLGKLLAVGLMHAAGHDCPRCTEPEPGDFVLHDYIGPNPSRATVARRRDAAAEKKRHQRAAHDSQRDRDRNERESPTIADCFDVDSMSKRPPASDDVAGDGLASRGDESGTRARPRPAPSPLPSTSYGSTAAAGAAEPPHALPDQLTDLKAAIAAAGLVGVSWQLRASQWEHTRQAMDRVGVPAMVAHAAASARLKGTPASAGAWVNGWRSLEAPPENSNVTYLPAAVGLPPQLSRTDQKVAAGLSLAARLEAEEHL